MIKLTIKKMIPIKINNFNFWVKSNLSILEACQFVGVIIPRFCYHETLSVSGNCRMCLVQLNNSEKPIVSCVTKITKEMNIWVNTPFVKKARENIIESLLANHPLDCPICDQGGECDLQDQTKVIGGIRSRFFFQKRGVENKYCGVFVKTIMNRCIHCTRCVRFGNEFNGSEILITLNRGIYTEIGTYISKNILSEISGNVIDLCPVGALTSKLYAFESRPWELKVNETIDFMDGLGSNLFVMFKESRIFRILPKTNNQINGNIISDKIRFSYDFVTNNRITKVYTRKKNDVRNPLTFCDQQHLSFFIDDDLDLETIIFLKILENNFNIKVKNPTKIETSKNIYISNMVNKIVDLESSFNTCFLLSSNPKLESSILNAKLRIKYNTQNFSIVSLGQTFFYENSISYVNLNVKSILYLLEGKLKKFSKILNNFKNIICLGESLNCLFSNLDDLFFFMRLKLTNVCLLRLNLHSNSETSKFLNIKCISSKIIFKKHKVLINLDDNLKLRKYFPKSSLMHSFWFNTHGSEFATNFDCIIPTNTNFEQESVLLNLEQRPQKTQNIITNSFRIKNIEMNLKTAFKIKNLNQNNNFCFAFLHETLKDSKKFNKVQNNFLLKKKLLKTQIRSAILVSKYPLKSIVEDFYSSNRLVRNSLLMQKASQITRIVNKNFL
jgi:NADH-quinone oxidoreductase subunit G